MSAVGGRVSGWGLCLECGRPPGEMSSCIQDGSLFRTEVRDGQIQERLLTGEESKGGRVRPFRLRDNWSARRQGMQLDSKDNSTKTRRRDRPLEPFGEHNLFESCSLLGDPIFRKQVKQE